MTEHHTSRKGDAIPRLRILVRSDVHAAQALATLVAAKLQALGDVESIQAGESTAIGGSPRRLESFAINHYQEDLLAYPEAQMESADRVTPRGRHWEQGPWYRQFK